MTFPFVILLPLVVFAQSEEASTTASVSAVETKAWEKTKLCWLVSGAGVFFPRLKRGRRNGRAGLKQSSPLASKRTTTRVRARRKPRKNCFSFFIFAI